MSRQLARGERACLRPADRAGKQAFLLVEAVLVAVVIAVGLVFISRGIAGSLKALSSLQQRDLLLRLAESTLNEQETEAQQFEIIRLREGTFDEPNEGYRWHLAIHPVQWQASDVSAEAFRAVTLTVSRIDQPTSFVRLNALWPSEWVRE